MLFTNIKKFQNVNKINQLIVVCTAPAPAVAPLTKNRSIVFSPSFKVKALAEASYDHYFSLQPSINRELEVLIEHFKAKGYERLGIISTLNDFWESYHQYLVELAKQAKIQLVADEVAEMNEADFRTLILRLKAKRPDVIFVGLNPEPLANFLRQRKELHVEVPLVGNWFIQTPDLLKIAAAEAEGLVYTYHYKDDSTQANKDFLAKYQAHYGEAPEVAAASSYDAIYIIKAINEKCIPSDLECLISETNRIKAYEGASGKFSFSKGSTLKNVFLKKIHKKAFIDY